MSNIFYYSKYCYQCRKAIELLKQRDMFDVFKKIVCVDNQTENSTRNDIPPQISTVPSIVTDDHNEPLINEMVYKWIDYKYIQRQENIRAKMEIQNQQQEISMNQYVQKKNENFRNDFPYMTVQQPVQDQGKGLMTRLEKMEQERRKDDQKFANPR